MGLVFSFHGSRSLLYCRFCGFVRSELRGFGFLVVGAFCLFSVFPPCIHLVYFLASVFGVFLIHLLTYQKNDWIFLLFFLVFVCFIIFFKYQNS